MQLSCFYNDGKISTFCSNKYTDFSLKLAAQLSEFLNGNISTRLVNRIANRDGDAVISSCASRDGQIAMILAIRLVILSLFRAESGHKACL